MYDQVKRKREQKQNMFYTKFVRLSLLDAREAGIIYNKDIDNFLFDFFLLNTYYSRHILMHMAI